MLSSLFEQGKYSHFFSVPICVSIHCWTAIHPDTHTHTHTHPHTHTHTHTHTPPSVPGPRLGFGPPGMGFKPKHSQSPSFHMGNQRRPAHRLSNLRSIFWVLNGHVYPARFSASFVVFSNMCLTLPGKSQTNFEHRKRRFEKPACCAHVHLFSKLPLKPEAR